MNPILSVRTVRQPKSLMLLCLLCLMSCLIVSANANAQQIHLRPSASIPSSIIRLGDIAEIVGGTLAEKSALQKLELFPMNPRTRSLSVSEIRDELAISGVDLLRWRLSGSNAVSLSPGNQGFANESKPVQNQLRRFPATPVSPRATLLPSQQMATTAIQQAVFQQPISDDSGFEADENGILSNPYRNGRGIQSQNPTTGEPAKIYGWTVRADMDRGAMVGEMDLERLELDRPTHDLVRNKSDILGKVVRSRLTVGQPIRQSSLEVLKYVQRGKEVKIVSQIDAISVSTVGRSLADATLGQDVTVESIDRSKKYVGRVTDFQTVTVSPVPNQNTIVASRADQRPGFNDPPISQTYRTADRPQTQFPGSMSRPNQSAFNSSIPDSSGQRLSNASESISKDRLPANTLR